MSLAPSTALFPGTRNRAAVGLILWFILSVVAALSGVLTLERRFLVPLSIGGCVAALVVLYRRRGALHALASGVDLRIPLALHIIRFPIGLWFTQLAAQGLDPAFVAVGGYGDMLSGGLAPFAVWAASKDSPRRRRVVQVINAVGFLEIMATMITAQRILLFSGHPETMAPLLKFPGPMLGFFIVPMVIASHLLVLTRRERAMPR